MSPYLWSVLLQEHKWEILTITDFQQSIEFQLTPEVNLTQVAELVALT